MQALRGSTEKLKNQNPILKDGQFGVERDVEYDKDRNIIKGSTKFRIKVGDGITPWNELPYLDPETGDDIGYGLVTKDNLGRIYLERAVGRKNTIIPATSSGDFNVVGEIFNYYTGVNRNIASGKYSHAEGYRTEASGDYSHAEGCTTLLGSWTYSDGKFRDLPLTTASGQGSHAEGIHALALGQGSHSEGVNTVADNKGAHSEGSQTVATGEGSHSEGFCTVASGDYSHVEGFYTKASGRGSHSEGSYTIASGVCSHAEGYSTEASGDYSHSEGFGSIIGHETKASGDYSHAEGYGTIASGYNSHAEGGCTEASGYNSHAEGDTTTASGSRSHAEGYHTAASGDCQHVSGKYNVEDTENKFAIIIGGGGKWDSQNQCNAVRNIYTLDWNGDINCGISDSEGNWVSYGTINGVDVSVLKTDVGVLRTDVDYVLSIKPSKGTGYGELSLNGTDLLISSAVGKKESETGEIFNSYAGDNKNSALGEYSHAEGWKTTASSQCSHAEGSGTVAMFKAHAEGDKTVASGNISHAEGADTVASGNISHAEGTLTKATGYLSHVEGLVTTASGIGSHAEGWFTVVSGKFAHAEGCHTIASGEYQHVSGKYNVEDTENKYAIIVGNGNGMSGQIQDSQRKNIYTLDWEGNINCGISDSEGNWTIYGTVNGVDVSVLKTDVDTLKTDVGVLKTDVNTLKDDTDVLKTNVNILKTNTEVLRTDVDYVLSIKPSKGTGYGELSLNGTDLLVSSAVGKKESDSGEIFNSYTGSSKNIASGNYSHAEGYNTEASGGHSHAEGMRTTASGDSQHVSGKYNVEDIESKYAVITGGGDDTASKNIYTLDWDGNINCGTTDTEGNWQTYGMFNGIDVKALKDKVDSISTGSGSSSSGSSSGAVNITVGEDNGYGLLGLSNNALTIESAVGKKESDSGEIFNSYTGDGKNVASGYCSHAEGYSTEASGGHSHAEGMFTRAQGYGSHAEGIGTIATGKCSHAEGKGTKALCGYQHVSGKFNIGDKKGEYAIIVGGGEDPTDILYAPGYPAAVLRNIYTLDWNGNINCGTTDTEGNWQTHGTFNGIDVNSLYETVQSLIAQINTMQETIDKLK